MTKLTPEGRAVLEEIVAHHLTLEDVANMLAEARAKAGHYRRQSRKNYRRAMRREAEAEQ